MFSNTRKHAQIRIVSNATERLLCLAALCRVSTKFSTSAFSCCSHHQQHQPCRQQRNFHLNTRYFQVQEAAPKEGTENAQLLAAVDQLLSQQYRSTHTAEQVITQFLKLINDSNDVTRDALQECFRRVIIYTETHYGHSKPEAVLKCLRLFEVLKKKIRELKAIHSNQSEILDPEMYATMFGIYSRNAFPEQAYELFEEINRLYFAEHKQTQVVQQKQQEEDDEDKEIRDPDALAASVAEAERAGSAHIASPQDFQDDDEEPSGPKEIFLPVFNDPYTYVYIIEACGKASRPEEVDNIIAFMQRNNIPLTQDIFHASLSAFTQFGNAQQALKYYSDFTKQGIRPTSRTLALMLEVFAKANDVRFAQIFDGMQRAGQIEPDAESLRAFLRCMCTISKDFDGARATLDRIRQHGGATADDYALLLSCCRENSLDPEQARMIFDQMRDEDHIEPTLPVCNALLRCYSLHDEAATFRLFEDLRKDVPVMSKPDAQSYNALIETCLFAGNVERARLVMRDMRKEGHVPDVISHNLFFGILYSNKWKPFLENIRSKKKRSIFSEIMQRVQKTTKIIEERLQQDAELSQGRRKGKHELVDTFGEDKVDQDEENLDMLLTMLKGSNKKQQSQSEEQYAMDQFGFEQASEKEESATSGESLLDDEARALMHEIDQLLSSASKNIQK